MMPLLPFIGPWIAQKLLGRLGAKWAGRIAQAATVLVIAILLAIIVLLIRNDAYADGQRDLRAAQAKAQAIADARQRQIEADAAATRAKALAAGATADAAQQKEITDATKDLPDARPSDRARRRACIELQQQSRAAGRAAPSC
jgi:hypothetical protein